jgi:hypothetical protein
VPAISKSLTKFENQKLRPCLGIDPGMNGGLALLFPDGELVYDRMPETQQDIMLWMHERCEEMDVVAVIEWINPAIFKISKRSMSLLYGSYRELKMALTASEIPFSEEMAATWQRAVGVKPRKKGEPQGKWKNRLRSRAQQLFPRLPLWKEPKSKGIQLAVADSILIAYYCQLREKGRT